MYSEEEFITEVFCMIDDTLKEVLGDARLRSRGFAPALSDAEVITIEIVGEFLGLDRDTAIWKYFRRHWRQLFPALGSRSTFARQAANLWAVKQMVYQRVVSSLDVSNQRLFLIDGFPMPVCAFGRAPQARSFVGQASIGYCATKKQYYYGFKGQIVCTASGVIVGVTVAPANLTERAAMWDALPDVSGWLIGDKGYIDRFLAEQLSDERDLHLETVRLRSNMKETRPERHLRALTSIRTLVESVISQLSERLHVERIRARDAWHLTSRMVRKILTHTVGVALLRKHGDFSLQLEQLIAA
jgi:hypothetical protein